MIRFKNKGFLDIGAKAERSKGKGGVTPDELRKMICYCQKQINRLSSL